MKKAIILYILPFLLLATGCGDLLDVKSDEKLSGDEFWTKGTPEDVEAFTLSIYQQFRDALSNNRGVLVASGDLRCAPVFPYISDNTMRNNLEWLRTNDLGRSAGNGQAYIQNITQWDYFYKAIQSANILIEEIGNVPDLPGPQVEAYKAEAVFMRNLSYFFLVRLFSDVPYYTNAYNAEALPRTNMVEVLKNCLADLQQLLNNDPQAEYLPWRHPVESKTGIRPVRGSVHILMMHINLWLAGFDKSNREDYYNNVITLGKEITEQNGGAYQLVRLESTPALFRGGTAESLFEVVQNIGADETFYHYAIFSNHFYTTSEGLTARPYYYYSQEFMMKVYPQELSDRRTEVWFDQPYTLDSNKKMITKFVNLDTGSSTTNSGNQIIFRYADAILLYAEALAEMQQYDEACRQLNLVRERAGATLTDNSGSSLRDEIYWERVRELIGEGHYFYDLVRTGKVYDTNYCFHYIPLSKFNAGAWTWPIHKDAQKNNTKIQLNNYWL